MAEQQITVRGVEMDLWKELRHAALDRGVPVGDMLNEILREWVERQRRQQPR